MQTRNNNNNKFGCIANYRLGVKAKHSIVDRNRNKSIECLMSVYSKAERIIHRVILDPFDKEKKNEREKKRLTADNNHCINRQKK
jgi:hypothetical protein